ncbi:hypothetical protein A2U01_0059373, partial [Trifolium medium]|nr:hypothetical protein [Trifolium medium]
GGVLVVTCSNFKMHQPLGAQRSNQSLLCLAVKQNMLQDPWLLSSKLAAITPK